MTSEDYEAGVRDGRLKNLESSLSEHKDTTNSIEVIDIAIVKLTPRQRQVINAEYNHAGHYKAKAQKLEISLSCYRSTLNHAKTNLINILEVI